MAADEIQQGADHQNSGHKGHGKAKGDLFFKQLYQKGYRIFAISDTYQEISLVKAK